MRRLFRQAFARDFALGALRSAPDWPPADPDPASLARAFRAAWDQGDAAAAVSLGRRMRSAGALEGAAAARLRRVLLQLGFHAEALELIEGGAPDADLARQRAWALAGLGRSAEAAAAIAEAERAGLGSGELAQLGELLGPESASAGALELGLELGLAGPVVDQLRGRFSSPDDPDLEALDLARAALRLASPDDGRRLLEALEPLYQGKDRRAWLSVRAIQDGGSDDEVLMYWGPGRPVRHRLSYILAAACAAQRDWPAAIRRFGLAVARLPRQEEHFYELDRCVEADLRARLTLQLAPPARRRRVIDVSPFNGEFTLLEIKLNEMADWVDRFVIYESPLTYTGLPKPLHFQQGKERFAKFADKIVHFVIDETPPYAAHAWARELYQRASAIRGLQGLVGPDDLVMLSDADEVLERGKIEAWDGLQTTCGLRTFCWFLNYRLLEPVKQGAKSCLVKGRCLAGCGTAMARLMLGTLTREILPEAGWHFTSVLTAEALKAKLDSYSHEDWAGSSVAEQAAFLRSIREGEDQPGYRREPVDESFPRFVREHREALAEFIL
jgi:hypothetical protein